MFESMLQFSLRMVHIQDENVLTSVCTVHYNLQLNFNPILPGGGGEYAPLLFFLHHPKTAQAETF